jgi:hypothetical protein
MTCRVLHQYLENSEPARHTRIFRAMKWWLGTCWVGHVICGLEIEGLPPMALQQKEGIGLGYGCGREEKNPGKTDGVNVKRNSYEFA